VELGETPLVDVTTWVTGEGRMPVAVRVAMGAKMDVELGPTWGGRVPPVMGSHQVKSWVAVAPDDGTAAGENGVISESEKVSTTRVPTISKIERSASRVCVTRVGTPPFQSSREPQYMASTAR
jgi:hypothetical protein